MRLISGPIIKTRFLGPTTHRDPRIVASHKRDSEVTWRKTITCHQGSSDWENHRDAACMLIENSPMKDWQVVLVACGHDADGYFWICSDAPISNPA